MPDVELAGGGNSRLGRVLLTNDDGIDASGLAVLAEIASKIADEVWIVAPLLDQSGVSHAITLHQPLRLSQRGPRSFAVNGTPGDSVVMAVNHVMKGAPPDLVLSGVNRGANIADDVNYSGTVGAAVTACLLGYPAIALSQAFSDGNDVPWGTVGAHAPGLIQRLARAGWPDGICLNLNFPRVSPELVRGVRAVSQGSSTVRTIEVEARTDLRSGTYYWQAFRRDVAAAVPESNPPVTDVNALAGNYISLTPLRFDRSDADATARFGRIFES